LGGRGVITVIGLDGSPLPPPAAAALATATLVVGGRRQLAAVAAPAGAATVALGELGPALDALAAHDGDAVVLASGDPGFFGILRALRERGLACTVWPGVSSVAAAFARAALPWDDAVTVSAHGRDLRRAVNVCRAYPKVAVLTGPGAGPAEIGRALAGWPRQLVVCEHLGSLGERVTACRPAAAARKSWEDPNLVLVLGPPAASPLPGTVTASGPAGARQLRASAVTARGGGGERGPGWAWPRPAVPAGWALPDSSFDARDSVITKAEVRALALARLAPAPGTLVWDVGAGAGSVAVECARFGAAVIAVERDRRRCGRVRANARQHGVEVRVVNAAAPGALGRLPEPDAVFVGGGGLGVLEAVAARGPARLVAALAAVERAGQAVTALARAGYTVDGALVQAARLSPLPDGGHRLASTNPVFLLWGARREQPGPPEVPR
jgi:precorrin-6Y C5,15-methyltransferase (decarboxylating)